MKMTQTSEPITYIETPRQHCDVPVKIDEILEARMRAFIKARRIRRFTFVKQATVNPIEEINEVVDIVPIYRGHASDQLKCVPWKMVYRGREIEFTKLGMRHPTEKGKRMIHAFNMTDGVNDYRIELDAERLIWTLIYVMGGEYV